MPEIKSPFTPEQAEKLSDFTSGLYDLSIWHALGELGGNNKPEDLIFPDLTEEYLKSSRNEGGMTSLECIYLAGERILKESES